jgi:hypothetical protein
MRPEKIENVALSRRKVIKSLFVTTLDIYLFTRRYFYNNKDEG